MTFGAITVTEGADRDVFVDDIAGTSVQVVKIFSAEEGSVVGMELTAGGSFPVDPRPTTKHDQVASAGLTTGATPYAANDTLGTGWEFPDYARAAGLGGKITGYQLLDEADVVVAVDLYFFDRAVTFGADNALITSTGVSDADGAFFIGKASLSVDDLTGCRVGAGVDSIPYHCNATSLFVYAVTRVAHNQFAAVTNLKLRIYADLD